MKEKENEYYVLEEVESGEVQAETQPDINVSMKVCRVINNLIDFLTTNMHCIHEKNENEHHYHVLESNEHRATEIEVCTYK